MELTIAKSDWMTLLRAHARRHRPAAIGLGFALLGVFALFAQSLLRLATGSAGPGPGFALLGGVVAFAATALGALPTLVLRGISNRSEDSLLGFAAGMMLAASAFSLLMPGLQAGEEIFRNQALGVGAVVFGMALGVLLMLGLDQFTPHEHTRVVPVGRVINAAGAPGCSSSPSPCTTCRRAWRLAWASRRGTWRWGCR